MDAFINFNLFYMIFESAAGLVATRCLLLAAPVLGLRFAAASSFVVIALLRTAFSAALIVG